MIGPPRSSPHRGRVRRREKARPRLLSRRERHALREACRSLITTTHELDEED